MKKEKEKSALGSLIRNGRTAHQRTWGDNIMLCAMTFAKLCKTMRAEGKKKEKKNTISKNYKSHQYNLWLHGFLTWVPEKPVENEKTYKKRTNAYEHGIPVPSDVREGGNGRMPTE